MLDVELEGIWVPVASDHVFLHVLLLWIAPAGLMGYEHLPVEHNCLSQGAARDRQVIYDTGTQGTLIPNYKRLCKVWR